jgi:hypothetical protein
MPPKAVKGVAASDLSSILEALKKARKFKQLATYSIQCVEKAIAPPRVGWEKAAKEVRGGVSTCALFSPCFC